MTRYLTSAEAMKALNYTNPKAFNRAVHALGIPHRYTGGRLAFEEHRLRAWVQTYKPKKRGPKPRPHAEEAA